MHSAMIPSETGSSLWKIRSEFCIVCAEMTENSKQLARRLCDQIQNRGKDRGRLIAFEGPDGSGKTTQRKLFKEWLVGEGYDVVTTKWNSSKLIKPIIKARKNIRSINQQEFCLLHAA